jgi:hypothetical protein
MVMKDLHNKINTGLAIAIIGTLGNLAQAQPASAQLLELATGALNILGIKGQQAAQQLIPQPPLQPQNRSFELGTENFNGNTLNLCFTGCLPNLAATRPTVPPPVFTSPSGSISPTSVPSTSVGIPQPGVSSSTIQSQTSTVRPGIPVSPQAIPPTVSPVQSAPEPRRPVLSIPPISLPINLGN